MVTYYHALLETPVTLVWYCKVVNDHPKFLVLAALEPEQPAPQRPGLLCDNQLIKLKSD